MASYDSVADIVRAMYVNTFGAEQQQQQQQAVDGWSLAGHIQRVLANDAEYMPYFLALLEEGEKVAEVKCLATGLRKENLRYGPHGEAGTLDDASDSKPGFTDDTRRIQEACKGVKL
ncbi:unnamed protein product [Adineta steineri]|uniref:Uncharacterized protein n=1 Tax=Adineta steineri TaxID=433720 RepID=A0A814CSX0_9BILA|nr:unnamed protein product [Adineta steineri]